MKISLVIPLLFLGVASNASLLMAQSPGTFTATGDMNSSRVSHTATLLENGKVLIAGGAITGPSAELYDPATGTFTPTGEMTRPTAGHTATLLPDGTVLIVGGYGSKEISAELYDPRTGVFSAIGNIPINGVMVCHAATLLSNGKVLVTVGTWWPGPTDLGIPAQLYDPTSATFAATGVSVASHRYEWTCPLATLLTDGKALVTWEDPDAEVYRPDTGTFNLAGYMTGQRGRQEYAAILMTNGKVLISGGLGDGILAGAELYDPASRTFTVTADMTTPRRSHTTTLLPDGKVFVAGGTGINSPGSLEPVLAKADLYDPATSAFSATGDMAAPRSGHTATLLPDGTVLLTGGAGRSQQSAELYNPAVLGPAPVLISVSGDKRQGAILHAGTVRIVTASDPAIAGEALEIYATGLIDDAVVPPRVAIGGRLSEILFFGKAPGYAGLNQINVRVPVGVVPGGTVPVRLNYLSRPSNEVTIGVQ